jgi:peptide chain release factor 1
LRRYVFSDAIQRRVDMVKTRHDEIMQEMSSSGRTPDGMSKELATLSHAAALIDQMKSLDEGEVSLMELMSEATEAADQDLVDECAQELKQLKVDKVTIESRIVDAVIPQDDEDYDSDAVVEVRAGTGGDEASLFAAELFESYAKAAKWFNWNVDILSESRTDIGGIREAAFEVSGRPTFRLDDDGQDDGPLLGPFGAFKFESGVHRVQRVPVNDSKIHTSACSVAVLPSIKKAQNQEALPLSELKIETMRSSGAGGQQ